MVLNPACSSAFRLSAETSSVTMQHIDLCFIEVDQGLKEVVLNKKSVRLTCLVFLKCYEQAQAPPSSNLFEELLLQIIATEVTCHL